MMNNKTETTNPIEIPSNIINLSAPKVSFKERKMTKISEMQYGFSPITKWYEPQHERLQIRSLEKIFNQGFPQLLSVVNVEDGDRFINPNPLDWRNPSKNETDSNRVYAWWEDIVYVLSQTVPDVAKLFFFNVGEFEDKENTKFFRNLMKHRITKVSKSKIVKNRKGLLSDELSAKVGHQMISNHFWTKIGNRLGKQYVTNYWMKPGHYLDVLLTAHNLSERVLPYFAELIIGEDWLTRKFTHQSVDDDLYGEVGDASTLFGVLTLLNWEDYFGESNGVNELENVFNSNEMKTYFQSETLDALKTCVTKTPENGVPIFKVNQN